MSKFIYIFEDWTIMVGGEPSEDSKQSADDGYLTIIDTENLCVYSDGDWVSLEVMTES